jgi:hypothetical protein
MRERRIGDEHDAYRDVSQIVDLERAPPSASDHPEGTRFLWIRLSLSCLGSIDPSSSLSQSVLTARTVAVA